MIDQLMKAASPFGAIRSIKKPSSIEIRHTPDGLSKKQWIYIRIDAEEYCHYLYAGIVDKTCVPTFCHETKIARAASDRVKHEECLWSILGERYDQALPGLVPDILNDMSEKICLRTPTIYALTKLAAAGSRKTFDTILEGMKIWEEPLYWPLIGSLAELRGYSREEVKEFFARLERNVQAAEELSK